MAHNIHEINIANWTDTGLTTPFPRYTFDLQVKWTDDEGVSREHNSVYTYPNDLSDVPLRVVRMWAEEQICAKVRVALGIDSWDNY